MNQKVRVSKMALRITIDIFSGRENPVLELKGSAAREALKRLSLERRLRKDDMGLPPSPTLGYRGLIIEQIGRPIKALPRVFRLAHGDVFGKGLAHRIADEAFEDFVFRSTGPIRKLKLGRKFPIMLRREIKRFRILRWDWPWGKKIIWPIRYSCRCAPLYEPNWWNDAGQIQFYNNCYNYCTDYRTDTFAQPGRASGSQYTALTCSSVRPGAIADDLINRPLANNRCPKNGHLVALVIWSGVDYHWYRKGRNGLWSHKPGGTAVTNLDNSGHLITDPRTANRGGYTSFCTFMVVMHGHIKIK